MTIGRKRYDVRTDSPYERLVVQVPEAPRREVDAPAVPVLTVKMPAIPVKKAREESEEESCG